MIEISNISIVLMNFFDYFTKIYSSLLSFVGNELNLSFLFGQLSG